VAELKYTFVLTNGRILDPVTGTDAIGDIGLSGSRIVEKGKELDIGSAEKVVDVSGKWVIPGVIDPHVHISSWMGGYPGLRMMAREGVVTALDMAGPPASVFFNVKNHGSGMNIACLNTFTFEKDEEKSGDITDREVIRRLKKFVCEGALGVKILGGVYPVSPEVTGKVIKYAAEMGIYTAFHAGTTANGSNLKGLREAVELSDGYPLHVAHINSYCRGLVREPLKETSEAVELLRRAPNIWSESYLNAFNGVSGKCQDGELHSQITKTCCRSKGFSADSKGLGEAIKKGYAWVVKYQGGENVLVNGDEGYRYWKDHHTDVTLSFPVNIPEVQLSLAVMKDQGGNFIVDALSTDGGGIPRNTMIRHGMYLVKMGALTPENFVRKTSTNAAKMLGLEGKGRLSPGADGDITVIDPDRGKAFMGIALGKVIMVDGIVTGNGGTIITTFEGEESVHGTGVDYAVVDIGGALRKKSA
jgi:hypothetical protein